MGRLSEALLGVSATREGIDSPVSVTTTADRILDQNPNRLFLTFINPSTNNVWIDPSADVAVGEGFIVSSNNGVTTFQIQEDGDVTTAEFHAIANGGPADLVVRGEEVEGRIPDPDGGES